MQHTRASWYRWATATPEERNRKVNGLLRFTASVERCAWPNCNKSTPKSFAEERIGVLCLSHAWSHYDAMGAYISVAEQRTPGQLFRMKKAAEPIDELTPAEEEREAALYQAEQAYDEDLKNWGWVYYLRVGDRIKIGFSTDVRRRLRAYPPGSQLLAVEFGHKKLERQRHLEFAEYLAIGREWFDDHEQIIQHTRDLVDLHGHPGEYAHNYRELKRPQDTKPQAMHYARRSRR